MVNDSDIVRLVNLGFSNLEMSKQLGVSPSTICRARQRLGITSPRKALDWRAIQVDHNAGASYRSLAKKYGCSIRTIQKAKIKGLFVTRIKPKVSEEHARKLRRESWARWNARRIKQTPVGEDIAVIRQFYMNCPEGYEVDHIIPLSKNGPHSISNLQYLTQNENRRKSAKLNWP